MAVKVFRADDQNFEDAWILLQEYFEAVQVVVRDDPATASKYLHDDHGGVWLAYADDEAAGCIVLRPLKSFSGRNALSGPGVRSGEVKRLYVRPRFRGQGIANRLLSALEEHAVSIQLTDLYLDTKDDLAAAIAFYQRVGYVRCERYNDNPQATIFMRKTLPEKITVRLFQPGDEEAFRSLNEEWISKLFELVEKDIQTLSDPQKYVLAPGGRIYFACRGNQHIACCALLNRQNGSYELGKMAVAEEARGKGVGRTLLEYVIADARRLDMSRLYLETNHKLENAIHLYQSVGFKRIHPEARSAYDRSNVFMELTLS